MPNYSGINRSGREPEEKRRIANRLLALKDALKAEVPAKTVDNLLLATWNIREFDSAAYGARTDESIYYIAEIIDHFDLVAVQEVRDDLNGLNRLMHVLGTWWNVIFTDVTEGSAGNRERMAFLYDTRKVKFGGLCGEVVLPDEKDTRGALQPVRQLARTPMMVGFQAGWYRFVLVTVHLIYGESTADSPDRIREAAILSDFLAARADEQTAWSHTMVLLGDFNIFKPDNETFQVIARNFFIPKEIQSLPSNVPQNKHYDQMAFRSPYLNEYRAYLEGGGRVNAGVFNFFKHVFREGDEAEYAPYMGDAYKQTSKGTPRSAKSSSGYYTTYWRTHQMSDHLPMWIELPIDRSVRYLEGIEQQVLELPPLAAVTERELIALAQES